jgi:hypothetical protein
MSFEKSALSSKKLAASFTVVSTVDLALIPCLSFITGKPQIQLILYFPLAHCDCLASLDKSNDFLLRHNQFTGLFSINIELNSKNYVSFENGLDSRYMVNLLVL